LVSGTPLYFVIWNEKYIFYSVNTNLSVKKIRFI